METTKTLVVGIIKGFVANPDAVETFLSELEDEKGKIKQINVKVDKADVGLCIGEKGQNAEALRRIIGLIGFRQTGERVYIRIDSPKIPKRHFSYEEDAR